jgi:fructose-specific phosphotransferase system IIA component
MDISSVLDEKCIILDFETDKKEEAIDKLTQLLFSSKRINSIKRFKKDLHKREKDASTAIGHGVAIPHAKSKYVDKPSVAFLRTKNMISYDSEKEDVNMFFLIAVPLDSNNEHLKILSTLAREIMNEDFLKKLLQAKSANEVFEIISNK